MVNVLGIPAAGPSHSHTSGIGLPPLHPTITSLHDLTTMGNPYAGITAPSAPAGNSSVTATAAEEELEDDGTEWAVRIGNAPPPMWSSKKRERESDQDNDYNKRPRLESGTTTAVSAVQALSDQSSLPSSTLLTIAKLHVIDQSIREIAKDFRFTVEEVKEYYDKCADMLKTRLRFQKMREELNTKFTDDL